MADRTILWTTNDPRNLSVTLTLDVWSHIVFEHNEIEPYPDVIRETIEDPDAIYFDPISTQKRGSTIEIHAYYRRKLLADKLSEKFVYVSVKFLEAEGERRGFVQTAVPSRGIQKRMVLIWTK